MNMLVNLGKKKDDLTLPNTIKAIRIKNQHKQSQNSKTKIKILVNLIEDKEKLKMENFHA